MKRCCKCHLVKTKTKYYKNRSNQDGLEYRCKECAHERDLERSAYLTKYRKEHRGILSRQFRNWIEEHRDQFRSNQKLVEAIKAGKIKRGDCTKCGKEDAEGHHSDYSRPLEVIWLCRPHHGDLHRSL